MRGRLLCLSLIFLDSFSNSYYTVNDICRRRKGRFTTIDPAKDGINWYAYCGNNPVMCIDPFGTEYGTLRGFVNEYAYLFENVSIETNKNVNFAYVTMENYERAFYFDGCIVERQIDENTGAILSEQSIKIADNKNGTLYLERTAFLEAMGMVADGTAVIETVPEFEVSNELAMIDLASVIYGGYSDASDLSSLTKFVNVSKDFTNLLTRCFAFIFTMNDLSNYQLMSAGKYRSEVIRVYSPTTDKYHRVDGIYGIEPSTHGYQF